ncbi:hypothetical protein ACSSS7_008247 [Eimeria intestinalis]
MGGPLWGGTPLAHVLNSVLPQRGHHPRGYADPSAAARFQTIPFVEGVPCEGAPLFRAFEGIPEAGRGAPKRMQKQQQQQLQQKQQKQQQHQQQQQHHQQFEICAASLLRCLTAASWTMSLQCLLRLSWCLPALTECSSSSSSGSSEGSSSNGCFCEWRAHGHNELEPDGLRPSTTLFAFSLHHDLQQQQQQREQQQEQQQQELGRGEQQRQQQQAIWRREKRALADRVLSQLYKHLLACSPAATTAAATGAAAVAAAHPSAAAATAAEATTASPALLVRGIHGLSRIVPRSKRLTSHGGPPSGVGGVRGPPFPPAVGAEVVRALVRRLGQLLAAATGVVKPAGQLAVPSPAAAAAPAPAAAATVASAAAAGGATADAAAAGPWGLLSLKEWALLLAAHSRLLLPLPFRLREQLQQILLPQQDTSCCTSVFGPPWATTAAPAAPAAAPAQAAATAAAAAAAAAATTSGGSWADACVVAQSLSKLNEGLLLLLLCTKISAPLTRHFTAVAAAAAAAALACGVGSQSGVAAASKPPFTVCSSSSSSSSSTTNSSGHSNSSSLMWVQQPESLAAQAEDWLSSLSILWGLSLCRPLHARGDPLLPGSNACAPAAAGAAAAAAAERAHYHLQQRWGPLFAALNALAAADTLLAVAARTGAPHRCSSECELGGPLAPPSARRQAVAAVLAAAAAAPAGGGAAAAVHAVGASPVALAAAKQPYVAGAKTTLEELLGALPLSTVRWLCMQKLAQDGSPAAAAAAAPASAALVGGAPGRGRLKAQQVIPHRRRSEGGGLPSSLSFRSLASPPTALLTGSCMSGRGGAQGP